MPWLRILLCAWSRQMWDAKQTSTFCSCRSWIWTLLQTISNLCGLESTETSKGLSCDAPQGFMLLQQVAPVQDDQAQFKTIDSKISSLPLWLVHLPTGGWCGRFVWILGIYRQCMYNIQILYPLFDKQFHTKHNMISYLNIWRQLFKYTLQVQLSKWHAYLP